MNLRGVLLDLGGVVYQGGEPLPGAIEALERLKSRGLALRFLTNTTRKSKRMLLEDLRAMGLPVNAEELFMPAQAACQILAAAGYKAHLLVHRALEEDFAELPDEGEEAVVVGDAGEGFTYAAMNGAFRKLTTGAPFYALAKNRSFMDADGELSIDAGAFVTALEYASGQSATVLGKPSSDFFAAALEGLGCRAGESVMVGDDAEADVGGAQAAGLLGVLVMTGKYRAGDERRLTRSPDAVVQDLGAAADWILRRA